MLNLNRYTNLKLYELFTCVYVSLCTMSYITKHSFHSFRVNLMKLFTEKGSVFKNNS